MIAFWERFQVKKERKTRIKKVDLVTEQVKRLMEDQKLILMVRG